MITKGQISMTEVSSYLHGFNFISVFFRLVLATLSAGFIGYGRTKRQKTAGFRTFMLTGLGACLSVLIAMYQYEMMKGAWAPVVSEVGMKFDASRYAAAVIGGIGFLASGSIIGASHQQVSGLTTATGLFASVCMGIAAGVGFYEVVILAMILIFIALNLMQPLEGRYKRLARNMTVYAEFESMDDVDDITSVIKAKNANIYEIDFERTVRTDDQYPSAIFSIKLSRENTSHSDMLSSIAELPFVISIEELIS